MGSLAGLSFVFERLSAGVARMQVVEELDPVAVGQFVAQQYFALAPQQVGEIDEPSPDVLNNDSPQDQGAEQFLDLLAPAFLRGWNRVLLEGEIRRERPLGGDLGGTAPGEDSGVQPFGLTGGYRGLPQEIVDSPEEPLDSGNKGLCLLEAEVFVEMVLGHGSRSGAMRLPTEQVSRS